MKKLLAGLTLVAGLNLIASAADPITWDQSLEIARQQNPDLISARKSLEARRAAYRESFNGLMPRLNLTSSYNRSHADPIESRWQAGANASMDIFNMGNFASIQSNSASFDAAQASLQAASAGVLLALRRAFAQLLYAQAQIDVSTNILEQRKRDAELVALRYDSGRESKGNRLRTQAELLQAKADLDQSYRDLRSAQQEFNRQLGQDQFEAVTATGALAVSALYNETFSDWNPVIDQHPSVLQQIASVDAAKADVRQAESALWPNLTANYSRTFQGDTYFPDNPNWSASGVVSLPIFAGGPTSAYYSVSGAKRSLESAQQALRSVRNQVRSDLESNWSSLASSRDQVKVQTAFLEAARQRNGEADVRYSSGLLSYENWELIVTDRVNFERSLIRAQRDTVIAEAEWENAMGKGLGD